MAGKKKRRNNTRSLPPGFAQEGLVGFLSGQKPPPGDVGDDSLTWALRRRARKLRRDRELADLRRQVGNLRKSRRGKETNTNSLRATIAGVRRKYIKGGNPSPSHREIAVAVDATYKISRISFSTKCPTSWLKVQNPPRSMAEALARRELKGRVKSTISSAK